MSQPNERERSGSCRARIGSGNCTLLGGERCGSELEDAAPGGAGGAGGAGGDGGGASIVWSNVVSIDVLLGEFIVSSSWSIRKRCGLLDGLGGGNGG